MARSAAPAGIPVVAVPAAASSRSTLLPTRSSGTPAGTRACRASSSAVQPALRSKSNSTASAAARAPRLRSMPSSSTGSVVARIPAVSSRVRGTPSSTSSLSSRSRVVPGRSVTMARSRRLRRLSRLLLPTLGRPTMATLNPSRRTSPCRAPSTRAASSPRTASSSALTASGSRGGRSSSKSTRASSSAS